ncbi:flagellar hook-associated protein FlgK [Thiomicrospira microaerophila]|uniref:flagellar hook-associated protein FlgK n=1 Tax=Thiomicrospira microaerophila TaxID=406020 RepID=UPI0005C86138|nr:flagellar hook-associated protein FlgK [Thiomicrospira microaerophila]
MADMLTIGSIAANNFKKALEVTSHNVANVGTEGYSRQRAILESNSPNVIGGHTILGGGSKVTTVERMYADHIQKQLLTSNGLVKGYEEAIAYAKQVEGIVASNDQGVQEYMQRYFDSLQNLADLPTSRVNREHVLDQARSLTGHINNMTTILGETQQQTNLQIQDMTKTINDHLNTIKMINQEVTKAESRGTQPPNDLLDKREQSIMELSNLIGVKTFNQPDGSIDIYSANARVPLLTDNNLTSLIAAPSDYAHENRTEMFININGEKRQVTDLLIGPGQLGGVLDFRKNVLDRAQNELGTTLNAFVAANNWQQYQGWDENGESGRENPIYKPLEISALANKNNQGVTEGVDIKVDFTPPRPHSGEPPTLVPPPDPMTYGYKQEELKIAKEQIGQLQPREYELRWNGTSMDVFDNATKKKLEMLDESGTPIDPLTNQVGWLDGLRFDLSANNIADFEQNDRFVIKPHKGIMEQFSVVMQDGQNIATRGQSPIPINSDPLNPPVNTLADISASITANNGGVIPGSVPPRDFEFINPATGIVFDVTDPDEFNAFRNSPAYRDYLNHLAPAMPGAEGDNVNAANMASIQSVKLMYANNNGQASETLLGGYSKMASSIGMFVRSAEINFETQSSSFSYINERREILSGVSLDEEAANLLRFQQAYQAAAQIMQASQQMFQTLIGVMRG